MRGAYTHSGKVGLAPLVVPVVGVLAALIGALLYAYISVYSPVVGVVTILVLLGFAFVVAFSVGLAGKLAKARNAGLMALLGGGVGLVAVYASWAAFLAVVIAKFSEEGPTPGYLDFLLNPLAVWEAMKLINESGWFSVSGSTPSGGVLWLFWGVEGVVIMAGGVMGGVSSISGEVFCEGCGAWAEEVEPPARFEVPEDEALIREIGEGSTSALASLPASDPVLGAVFEVTVHQCESCQDTATYQTKLVKRTLDDKGNESVDKTDLTPQILCDAEQVEAFRRLAARRPGEGEDHEAVHAGGDEHREADEDDER